MMSTGQGPDTELEREFVQALNSGNEALAVGRLAEAVEHLQKARGLRPDHEKALNLLGLTHFKLGHFDRAAEVYERLVEANPIDPTLRVNLGLVYLKSASLPRSIREFETATSLDPNHQKAHNYLGLALAQTGDYASAKEHFVAAGAEAMADKMTEAMRSASAPVAHPADAPASVVLRGQPDTIEVMSEDEGSADDVDAVEIAIDAPPPASPRASLGDDWSVHLGHRGPSAAPALQPGDSPSNQEPGAGAFVAMPAGENYLGDASIELMPVVEATAEVATVDGGGAAIGPALAEVFHFSSGRTSSSRTGARAAKETGERGSGPIQAEDNEALGGARDDAWLVAPNGTSQGLGSVAELPAGDSRRVVAEDVLARHPDAATSEDYEAGSTITAWETPREEAEPSGMRVTETVVPVDSMGEFPLEAAWPAGLEPASLRSSPEPLRPAEAIADVSGAAWSGYATEAALDAANGSVGQAPVSDDLGEAWDASNERGAWPGSESTETAPDATPVSMSAEPSDAEAEAWTGYAPTVSDPLDAPPDEVAPGAAEAWSSGMDATPYDPPSRAPDGDAASPEAVAASWSQDQHVAPPLEEVEVPAGPGFVQASPTQVEDDAWASVAEPEPAAPTPPSDFQPPTDGVGLAELPDSAAPPAAFEVLAEPEWLAQPLNEVTLGHPASDDSGQEPTYRATSEAELSPPLPEAPLPLVEPVAVVVEGAPVDFESAPVAAGEVSAQLAAREPVAQTSAREDGRLGIEATDSPRTGYTEIETKSLGAVGASTQWVLEPSGSPFLIGVDGLAISVIDEMRTRLDGLVAIVGNASVTPELKRVRGRATETPFGAGVQQLNRIQGNAVLYFDSDRSDFRAFDLADEGVYVREEHLFAFEEPIAYENGRLTSEDGHFLDLVHLNGRGRVLLRLKGRMRTMPIPAGSPTLVPLARVVGWFGQVTPRLRALAGLAAVELTGDGFVLLGATAERG